MNSSTKLSRQEKIELLELQDERQRRRSEDPLKYIVEHDKQKHATAADEAIRALFWGNRVGKSEWGGHETARYATGRHPHRGTTPPFEIWAACPSFDVQEHTTQKKLLACLPPKDIARIEYLRGKIIKKLQLKNGVTILFKSYEQGREKFQGAGVRLIWFDEEPPRDIWEECFVRVEAGQQLDVILTMTAVKGMTWVYDQIYLDTGNPDLYISEAGWDDNPWLTEKQKEQMARGLTPEALKVRREGRFTKRVGMVCAWWDRTKHLRHYDHLDRSWTWYEVLDGGWSDPAAWLLVGVDHDDNIHVVDGYREPQKKNSWLKTERDKKISGLTITRGWIDSNEPRLQQELSTLKVDDVSSPWHLDAVEKVAGESKNWDETLAEKLAEYGQIETGTGQPRLYISDTLIRTSDQSGREENWLMQEIENLVWLEKSTKQGESVEPKWDDHRRYGHHFDGIRALAYLLVSYKKRSKNPTVKQAAWVKRAKTRKGVW